MPPPAEPPAEPRSPEAPPAETPPDQAPPAPDEAPAPDAPEPPTDVPPEPSPEAAPSEQPEPEAPEPVDTPTADASVPEAPPDEVEVIVVGMRSEQAPGAAHVLNKKQLERFRRDDPNAIVTQVPGVTVRQEDGVGLRPNIGIRGVNSDRSKKVTLTEDGVLFGPAPYSAPAAYYFPLMARMVQVQVIKGPSAISHGPQTVGGAIDFISRPIPDQVKAMFDLGLGEYGYLKTHGYYGASTERFGFLVEGVRLRDGGFKQLPSGADTGSTRNEWVVKTAYEPESDGRTAHRFSAKLIYSDEVSNETYLGLTDADFERNPNQRYPASALDQMKSQRTALVLSHLFEVPELSLELKTDVYRNDYSRVWRKLNALRGAGLSSVLRDPEDALNAEYYAVLTGEADGATAGDTLLIGPNDRTFVSQGAQSVLRWKPESGALSHAIEAGIRVHYDSADRRHSQAGYVMTNGQLIPEGTAEEVNTSGDAETQALAFHALDALNFWRFTLTPGVRLELIRMSTSNRLNGEQAERDLIAVMPGLGGYYALTEHFGLLAGVYRGFSPPAPGTDDHVEPEYSVNTEAGVRFRSSAASVELIGFYNDYSNLTDICTLSSGCLTENLDRQLDAGEARIYGFEAHTNQEWSLGGGVKLPVLASYTHTRAEFRNDFSSTDPIYGTVSSGDELPYIPRHQVTGSVGAETESVGAVVGVGYVTAMREQPGDEPLSEISATDEQFWLDFGARYAPWRWLTLYANVRNVLDHQVIVSRRPYGARPNAPRWIQVGAKVEY